MVRALMSTKSVEEVVKRGLPTLAGITNGGSYLHDEIFVSIDEVAKGIVI